MVDPAISDLARKDLLSKSKKRWMFCAGSHILKIMELSVVGNKVAMEWFEQNPAGKLSSNQVAQPGRPTPGSTRYQDTPAQVRCGIEVETAAK